VEANGGFNAVNVTVGPGDLLCQSDALFQGEIQSMGGIMAVNMTVSPGPVAVSGNITATQVFGNHVVGQTITAGSIGTQVIIYLLFYLIFFF